MNIKWSSYLYSTDQKDSHMGAPGDCFNWHYSLEESNGMLSFITSCQPIIITISAEGRKSSRTSMDYENTSIQIDKITGKCLHQEQHTSNIPLCEKGDRPGIDVNSHYFFEGYEVFMSGEWTLCCHDIISKKLLWQRNIRHYLYTEIECKNHILYFNTSGNGGIFYGLSLKTGDILVSFPGNSFSMATYYHWILEHVLVCSKSGYWTLIDAKNGAEIERMPLKGNILFRSLDTFYLLTSEYNRSQKQYDVKLVCVEFT